MSIRCKGKPFFPSLWHSGNLSTFEYLDVKDNVLVKDNALVKDNVFIKAEKKYDDLKEREENKNGKIDLHSCRATALKLAETIHDKMLSMKTLVAYRGSQSGWLWLCALWFRKA